MNWQADRASGALESSRIISNVAAEISRVISGLSMIDFNAFSINVSLQSLCSTREIPIVISSECACLHSNVTLFGWAVVAVGSAGWAKDITDAGIWSHFEVRIVYPSKFRPHGTSDRYLVSNFHSPTLLHGLYSCVRMQLFCGYVSGTCSPTCSRWLRLSIVNIMTFRNIEVDLIFQLCIKMVHIPQR